MDFAYIASQTFGDLDLERELLALFAAQARRLLLELPARDAQGQSDTAHLLKGSARAVGATRVAAAAEAYEATLPGDDGGLRRGDDAADPHVAGPPALRPAAVAFEDRAHAFRDLADAIEDAADAIARHLDGLKIRPA